MSWQSEAKAVNTTSLPGDRHQKNFDDADAKTRQVRALQAAVRQRLTDTDRQKRVSLLTRLVALGPHALGAPEGQGVQEQAGYHLTAQERHQRGDEADHRRDSRPNHENLQHVRLPIVMKRDDTHLEHLL